MSLYVAIGAINRSTLIGFRESIDSVAGKATLSVTSGQAGFPEETLTRVEAVPGVARAVPMITSTGRFAGKDSNRTIYILGVDLLKESAVRTYQTENEEIMEDPLVLLNQPDSIILTREFARTHGLKMESKIALATQDGQRTFTVRGLLTPEGPAKAYGGAIAIMDIDGARVSFGKVGKLDRIDVIATSDVDAIKLGDRITQALGPGFLVQRPETQSEEKERLVSSFQTMLSFFSTLALAVGLFMVANAISISVAERRKEIGLVRAIGATRSQVLTLFLGDAAIVGLLGALLGVALGRVLSEALVGMVTDSLKGQFVMQAEIPRISFNVVDALRSLGFGVAASLLAGLWPALKSMRIGPLEAITRADIGADAEADEAKGRCAPRVPLFGAVLLAASCFACFYFKGRVGGPVQAAFNILSLGGCVLLGPWVAIQLIRLWRRAFVTIDSKPAVRLAFDNLLRNPRRTASNIAVLMVGLIFVIIVSIARVSLSQTLLNWVGNTMSADLIVSGTGRLVGMNVTPIADSLRLELDQVPGMKSAKIDGIRSVSERFEGKPFLLKAFDLFESNEARVSDVFANRFRKKVGDELRLDSPSGPVIVKIRKVVTDFASPLGTVHISRELYKRNWKDSLVAGFFVTLAPGESVEKVRDAIDHKIGAGRNFMITLNQTLRTQIVEHIERSFAFVGTVEWLALIVGLLGILNTVMVSVMERFREIGMLRAVGMSRKQVFSMVMLESVIQGVAGGIASVALGTLIGWVWTEFSLTDVLGWIVEFHYPMGVISKAVIAGAGVAVLAGFLPARRAASFEIREALTVE